MPVYQNATKTSFMLPPEFSGVIGGMPVIPPGAKLALPEAIFNQASVPRLRIFFSEKVASGELIIVDASEQAVTAAVDTAKQENISKLPQEAESKTKELAEAGLAANETPYGTGPYVIQPAHKPYEPEPNYSVR